MMTDILDLESPICDAEMMARILMDILTRNFAGKSSWPDNDSLYHLDMEAREKMIFSAGMVIDLICKAHKAWEQAAESEKKPVSPEASTRLENAAPDLLEALEALMRGADVIGHPPEWGAMVKAKAAVAKAKGVVA